MQNFLKHTNSKQLLKQPQTANLVKKCVDKKHNSRTANFIRQWTENPLNDCCNLITNQEHSHSKIYLVDEKKGFFYLVQFQKMSVGIGVATLSKQ